MLLSVELHGPRSLAGYSPWGPKGLDTTEQLTLSFSLSCLSFRLALPHRHSPAPSHYSQLSMVGCVWMRGLGGIRIGYFLTEAHWFACMRGSHIPSVILDLQQKLCHNTTWDITLGDCRGKAESVCVCARARVGEYIDILHVVWFLFMNYMPKTYILFHLILIATPQVGTECAMNSTL